MRLLPKISGLCIAVFMVSCNSNSASKGLQETNNITPLELNLTQAKKIIELPLGCIELEYPNKLGQVLDSDKDLATPKALRPIFYGCFDWHSSVHGYWSIITLLERFPELDANQNIKTRLDKLITPQNLAIEKAFFEQPYNRNFERTYGWAWLLQLHKALKLSKDPDAIRWSKTIEPLANLFVQRYQEYLPKLVYPVRTGTHDNTAYGLALALNYAKTMELKEFEELIVTTSKRLYQSDLNCNLSFEPSGHDFLSPCLQEAMLMGEVLNSDEYPSWLQGFLPELFQEDFSLEIAKVSDRSDGHLVHLDGLNFSRANCLITIANKIPSLKPRLIPMAHESFNSAFANISDDDYMGSHWLGTFALYTLVNQ
ncbi:DUF2891 domain-containing protein [Myroides sp. LJL119]